MSTQLLRKYIDILNEVQSQAYPAPISNQVNTDPKYQFSDPEKDNSPEDTKDLVNRYGLTKEVLFGSRPENLLAYSNFKQTLRSMSDDQLQEIGRMAVGLHNNFSQQNEMNPGPDLYSSVVRELKKRKDLRKP